MPIESQSELYLAYQVILNHLRSNTKDPNLLTNFEGSENRCVKALLETCRSDEAIAQDLKDIVHRVFPVHRGGTRSGA